MSCYFENNHILEQVCLYKPGILEHFLQIRTIRHDNAFFVLAHTKCIFLNTVAVNVPFYKNVAVFTFRVCCASCLCLSMLVINFKVFA